MHQELGGAPESTQPSAPSTALPPSGKPAASPVSTSNPSVEVQFEQYKEKTKQWKQAVKLQLEDAASKNANLREELRRREAEHEAKVTQLRDELTADLDRRMLAKDAQLAEVTAELQRARREANAELEELRGHMAAKEREIATDLQSSHASHVATLTREHAEEVRELQEELARATRSVENARHELALTQAKLQQAKTNCDDLQQQITQQHGSAEQWMAQQNSASAKELDALKQQLELYASKNAALVEESQKIRVDHQQELRLKDELREDEVQRREERIIVLQTILKSVQSECDSLHLKWSRAQAEHQRQVDALAAEKERTAASLYEALVQVEELRKRVAQLEDECTRNRRTIADLEELSAIRDKTFQELLMSEDQKVMVSHLEHRLNVAAAEAALWQDKFTMLQRSLDTEKALLATREAELAAEESQLSKKQASLVEKQAWIASQEKKLREQHLQISAHASQVLTALQVGSGDSAHRGAASSLLLDSVTSTSNNDGDDGVGNPSSMPFYRALREGLNNVHQNYMKALARANGSKRAAATILFRHYRRFLPILITVVFGVTVLYWYLFSGATVSNSGERSMSTFQDMTEELKAMKREYGLLVAKMTQCCPQEPPPLPIPQQFVRRAA